MSHKLPPRPNLDHLRRQARDLLDALKNGDLAAIAILREHLPAAAKMSAAKVRAAGFRLADAQAAIARKTGFAGWPQLARHVEQLRALEGTWEFVTLEVEGQAVPHAGLSASRLLIDGDRFRMESPEATYEGYFNIDVESEPQAIDLHFVAGPEAGNVNYGIFCFDGERLDICLDMNGKPRPTAFRAKAGSGHAFESLRRASKDRPAAVTGGTPPPAQTNADLGVKVDRNDFKPVASALLARLQGEWTAEKLVSSGQEIPSAMYSTGRRSVKDNEIKITFGGQMMIHALIRLDVGATPVEIDYLLLAGANKDLVQLGIMQWSGDVACFCMASPGQPRPADFECPPGSGRTLSHWRQIK